jgi:hypothetical protein
MAQFQFEWDPFNQADPGPVIDVLIGNPRDVVEAGRTIGFEYPEPHRMKALLDTGANVTVISSVYANYCKLFQTYEGSEITAVGAKHRCGEHAGAISFPGTNLRPFDSIRIVSAVFEKEPFYACLIGRDILRNWVVNFDGRTKRVTITD